MNDLSNAKPVIKSKCKNCNAYKVTSKVNGSCRRYPPTVVSLNNISSPFWPTVSQDDWCREWEPIDDGEQV